jgi:carbon monoxide dehydrogenase subunit G
VSLAYVSSTVDADLAAVWSVLGDFHGMSTWIGRIEKSEPEGGEGRGAVGSVRRLTLTGELRVRERLVHYDEPGHQYSYEFDGEVSPFPVAFYRGTVHLLPITETGSTFIEWYGEYDCETALVEQLRATFTAIYTEFIADLRKTLS